MPTTLDHARTTHARYVYAPPNRDYKFLISLEDAVDVPTTVAHAKAWAIEFLQSLPANPTAAQTAAFARIFGTWDAQNNTLAGGFVDDNAPLVFAGVHRGQLAFELGLRVFEPIKIRQKTHGICGTVVMMQEVCTREPDAYVQYVLGLVTQRRGRLNVSGQGLRVKIRTGSNILGKVLAVRPANIAQADYVALVSLRNSENFLPYRSKLTVRMLECGTSNAELVRWLQRAGYTHVRDRTRSRLAGAIPTQTLRTAFGDSWIRPHVQRMANELNLGCVIYLVSAGDLGKEALGRARLGGANHMMMNVFGGHVMRVLGVTLHANGVRFRLVTWGAESDGQREISWSKMTSWYRGYIVGTP